MLCAGCATGEDVAPGRNTFERPAKTVNSSSFSSCLMPHTAVSGCTRQLGSRAVAMARRAFSFMRFRMTFGRECVNCNAAHSDNGTYEGLCSTAVISGSFLYQRAPFVELCHGIIRERGTWSTRGDKGKDDLEDEVMRPCVVRVSYAHTYSSRERIRPYSPEARDDNTLDTELVLDFL